MRVDEYGVVWLTDPWVSVLAFLVVVGLVLWSHRWIATSRLPRPRTMAVRIPRERRVPRVIRTADLRALPRLVAPSRISTITVLRPERPASERPKAA